MNAPALISDPELLVLMPELVLAERTCTAEVIEHLVEIDRRRLYLDAACPSLSSYCSERLRYSENEAANRVRVTRLASKVPQILDELRSGRIHLTGLGVLAPYLTADNAGELLAEACHKSRRLIEELVARRFPRRDVPDRIGREPEQLNAPLLSSAGTAVGTDSASTFSGTGTVLAEARGRVEPLSESRWSVQFTASGELRDKIERARQLVSHALPNGDLASLFERALDALIERETKRRLGAGKPRKRRALRMGSRHIPVEIARQVWERDGAQCTFVDAEGRRCTARRFITLEHREPFALGGPPTVENLCLRCMAHNAHAARQVFGEAHIEAKCAERRAAEPAGTSEVELKVHRALRKMGFPEAHVRRAMNQLRQRELPTGLDAMLRAALGLLVPSNGSISVPVP